LAPRQLLECQLLRPASERQLPFNVVVRRADGLGDEVRIPVDAKGRFRLRLPHGRYACVIEKEAPRIFEVPHEGPLTFEMEAE